MIIRVFDTESDGFRNDATRLWCISCRDLGSRQERFFDPFCIREGLEYLMEADVVVAHNFLGHDYPLIKRLYPWFEPKAYEDSLILSRLYNPDRVGGHSINAWGQRLGKAKPVHEDWSQYSEEMRVRCTEDTLINCMLLRVLIDEGSTADWRDAIRTEYDAQLLQNQIEDQGFLLDIPAAEALADELSGKLTKIEEELNSVLPWKVKAGTTYAAPFTKAGTLKKVLTDYLTPEQASAVNGPLSKVEFIPFSFNSPQQVTAFLYSQGWQPNYFNYKKAKRGGYELNDDGTYVISSPRLPKADEDQSCLDTIQGAAGQLFLTWRVLTHRLGLIHRVRKKDGKKGGWLNEVRTDGRVEAQAIPLGTNTGRYTHRQIVNIPAVGSLYGEELRSLLCVPQGHILSGTDASGLEARVAGHYTTFHDGGVFATELLEGDVHTKNAHAFSHAAGKVVTRQQAKTIYYAILYGATARKVATQVGVSLEVGSAMLNAFWEANPALACVREEAIEHAKKHGWVPGLDGRRIMIRSPHSATNAQFQSAGAIIMKNCFNRVLLDAPRWRAVCTMHDEAQTEVAPMFGHMLQQAWVDAGDWVTDKFKLNVPIEFDTQTGLNYAETH